MKTLLKMTALSAGCIIHGWSRGERELYTLVAWAIFGAIVGAASVFVDRWNTVQISDDKHRRE